MKNHRGLFAGLLMVVFSISCNQQNKTQLTENNVGSESKYFINSDSPSGIVRNIEQDKNGSIWIASWEGIFRTDGSSFTNFTKRVSSARFFSVLQDSKGNMWFGSIGSGVFYFDGKRFRNFTTEDGLLNNEITCIYQDKAGNIWFGVNGGASRYDGKSFRNYMIKGDFMSEERTGKTFPDFTRPPNAVSSIIEDKTGKFWVATSGHTFVFDGNDFDVFTHNGKPFTNVRSVIEDQKGNIWLGGNDGLWRYDGNVFTNIAKGFVGYIYEDKKGNILTSSETSEGWALSRYYEKSLSNKIAIIPEVIRANEGMIFGILEANDGSIWFGTLDGVKRFDGKTVNGFKALSSQEYFSRLVASRKDNC